MSEPRIHYEARAVSKYDGYDICRVNESGVAITPVGVCYPKTRTALDQLIADANAGLLQRQLTEVSASC